MKNINNIKTFEKKVKTPKLRKSLFSKKQRINLSDKKRLTTKGKVWWSTKHLLLILIAVIILFPISYLVIAAFNGNLGNRELTNDLSYKFSAKNFSALNDSDYWTWITNSLIMAIVTMVIVVIFSGFMAYAFSRYSFTGKKSWLIFVMVIGLVPNVIALIVFYIMTDILADHFGISKMFVLIMIYSSGGIVGNVYVLKSYMDGISSELDDSGKIDGLSNWKLFTRIIGPLAKPMISIIAFWAFVAPFGDFIISSMIIIDKSNYTLPMGLMQMAGKGLTSVDQSLINYPAFTAGALIASIPIVATFLILQRNVSAGATEGGVKG